jgi:glycosyltransferase involved in cell wall biosynthesis
VDGGKIDVVTNGVDTARFDPSRSSAEVRAALGVPPDVFLAGYIGTTGMAHGLATVLDAAERCRERPDLRFLVMGEGAERASLEQSARERGLENVIFRDFVPHDQVPAHLGALDASLVHLRPDPVFETVIPSKIFEAMAMGVPIVMAVPGESAAIVEETGAGICIPSGDGAAMADAVARLASDAGLRERLGQNGRAAAGSKYSRQARAEAALACLEAAVAGARA